MVLSIMDLGDHGLQLVEVTGCNPFFTLAGGSTNRALQAS